MSVKLFALSDFVGEKKPQLKPDLIYGALRQGHVAILAGGSKSGKTWAAIQLAIAAANSDIWFGRACSKSKVLFVDFETAPASLIDRFDQVIDKLQRSGRDVSRDGIDVLSLRGVHAPQEELFKTIENAVKQAQPQLTIIDPIYRLTNGDENNAVDVARQFAWLDYIAETYDTAILFTHHHSKGQQAGKGSLDRASGSGVYGRAPDASFDLIEVEISSEAKEQLQARGYKNIDGASGFRLECVFRDFKSPPPMNGFFDYPVHVIDETGILQKARPKAEARAYDVARSVRASNRVNWSKCISEAYKALSADNAKVTISEIANWLQASEVGKGSEGTIRKELKKAGFETINGEVVPIKADGETTE